MAKKKRDEGGGGPNWLDTYADMVTLLLTFFVMLFAMSSVDADKWQLLVQAFSSRGTSNQQIVINPDGDPSTSMLGPVDPGGVASGLGQERNETEQIMEFDDLYYYLKRYVENNGLQGSVNLYKGDDYTFMTFRDNIFFDGDSAVLQPQGKKVLDILSGAIAGIPKQINEIRFYGHTAHVGDSKMPANQMFDRRLSVDRATNVLLYVQLKGVIEPKKLISEGYGEWRPIVVADGTEAARKKNRRVEIYISNAGTTRNMSLTDIYSDMSSNPTGTEISPTTAVSKPSAASSPATTAEAPAK